MTTKPKARKFRIRRTAPGTDGTAAPAAAPANTARRPDGPDTATQPPSGTQQPAQANPAQAQPAQGGPAQAPRGTAPQQAAQPHPGNIASARETQAETDIDAIRREGLTGRQLRMARRVAQKHGLAPISDFDAVRQLRVRGIDPFQRANMLELVVPGEDGKGGGGGKGGLPVDTGGQPPDTGRVQLPQTVQADKQTLPSTETVSPAQRRQAEITEIQRDIARRRRRKLALLFTRLSAFVFIPTILAGYYYFVMATPMYATNTQFLILAADGGGSGLRGLLPSQYATSQDSIAVQSYLQSKDAMRRLDAEHGFKAHFSSDKIDSIQRLPKNASNEQAYKLYKKVVKIGYDPTEGVIRMEVIAADPQVALKFSELLVTFAEERVDELSRKKREDGMRVAEESLQKAKQDRRIAQQHLVQLQESEGVDPTEQLAVLRSQISNYETQLQEKQLQLAALNDNARPNAAKVQGAEGDVRRLKELLAKLNGRMTEASGGLDSLAARSASIQLAQADLTTADLFMQTALQTAKEAELQASKQVRYLTVPVRPIAAEDPTYPRAFENTILAFLIFAGIYLMISLTSSILREQVSS
jgi:capsular polysaccharide transport system permease protein